MQMRAWFRLAPRLLSPQVPPSRSQVFLFRVRVEIPRRECAMIANLRNLTKEKREVPMKRHLRNFAACFALLLMAAVLVTPALGQVTEGFENGIPASWTFSGPAGLDGTADSSSGITPTEGSY